MKNLIAFVLAGLLAVSSSVPATSAALENAASSEAGSTSITVDVSIDPTLAPDPPAASGATENPEPGDSVPLPSNESSTTENEPQPEQPADSDDSEAPVLPDDGTPTLNETETISPESLELEEITEAAPPLELSPARFDPELCCDLADEQAGSLMGHYGIARTAACTTIAVKLLVADYEVSTNLDQNYALVWGALQESFEKLAAEGHAYAECVYQDGAILVYV